MYIVVLQSSHTHAALINNSFSRWSYRVCIFNRLVLQDVHSVVPNGVINCNEVRANLRLLSLFKMDAAITCMWDIASGGRDLLIFFKWYLPYMILIWFAKNDYLINYVLLTYGYNFNWFMVFIISKQSWEVFVIKYLKKYFKYF